MVNQELIKFGVQLKTLRKGRGLSQEQLGKLFKTRRIRRIMKMGKCLKPEMKRPCEGDGGAMNKLPSKIGQQVQPYEVWEETAKELIECEMARSGIGYRQLSQMLEKLGIHESPDQINRKVLRKRFSAAFLLACLQAMGIKNIPLI